MILDGFDEFLYLGSAQVLQDAITSLRDFFAGGAPRIVLTTRGTLLADDMQLQRQAAELRTMLLGGSADTLRSKVWRLNDLSIHTLFELYRAAFEGRAPLSPDRFETQLRTLGTSVGAVFAYAYAAYSKDRPAEMSPSGMVVFDEYIAQLYARERTKFPEAQVGDATQHAVLTYLARYLGSGRGRTATAEDIRAYLELLGAVASGLEDIRADILQNHAALDVVDIGASDSSGDNGKRLQFRDSFFSLYYRSELILGATRGDGRGRVQLNPRFDPNATIELEDSEFSIDSIARDGIERDALNRVVDRLLLRPAAGTPRSQLAEALAHARLLADLLGATRGSAAAVRALLDFAASFRVEWESRMGSAALAGLPGDVRELLEGFRDQCFIEDKVSLAGLAGREVTLRDVAFSPVLAIAFDSVALGGLRFEGCSFDHVVFRNCDFTGASIVDCSWVSATMDQCRGLNELSEVQGNRRGPGCRIYVDGVLHGDPDEVLTELPDETPPESEDDRRFGREVVDGLIMLARWPVPFLDLSDNRVEHRFRDHIDLWQRAGILLPGRGQASGPDPIRQKPTVARDIFTELRRGLPALVATRTLPDSVRTLIARSLT